jgi:hypothetical protein
MACNRDIFTLLYFTFTQPGTSSFFSELFRVSAGLYLTPLRIMIDTVYIVRETFIFSF